MVWWLFSKKEEKHSHIKKVESTLKNSFDNIKSDIYIITSHVHKHKGHIKELNQRLEKIEHNIAFLHGKLDKKEAIHLDPELDTEEEYYDTSSENIIDNLTTVQKSILLRLAHLQTETNELWISSKNLTEDLYPEKEYSKIRPMMSDYLNILLDFGLINKIRKRRQTYISLSKKSLSFIPKNKQKKLIKIFQRK